MLARIGKLAVSKNLLGYFLVLNSVSKPQVDLYHEYQSNHSSAEYILVSQLIPTLFFTNFISEESISLFQLMDLTSNKTETKKKGSLKHRQTA